MYRKQRIVKEILPYLSAADIFRKVAKEKDSVFLDSSLVNTLGHYSIIGRRPYLKLVKEENSFTVNGQKQTEGTFEAYVRKFLQEHHDENPGNLPILSGAIGYFSYEYGRKRQQIPSVQQDMVCIPDAVLTFYDSFLIEDCQKKKLYLVANGITQPATETLQETEKLLAAVREETNIQRAEKIQKTTIRVTPNFAKEEYKKTVDRMIQYIIEGDIYIANMTQHLAVESEKAPIDVFYDLRRQNPSPFGGYLSGDDYEIVCASPERFLKMRKNHVNTRPIKGTRKRGATKEEDATLRRELQESEKDKSELLMIVDLERNDLNRVCQPGSVKVTELFTVEEYATVFHLVSDIEGELKEGKTVMDLMEAAFPGGSITGAPKYRAMEIIDELEHGRRNLYTGSIGYLTLCGDCDFNIVIRTALHKDGKYYLGVGGGITAESELEFEYEETLQKAKAVLDALQ